MRAWIETREDCKSHAVYAVARTLGCERGLKLADGFYQNQPVAVARTLGCERGLKLIPSTFSVPLADVARTLGCERGLKL